MLTALITGASVGIGKSFAEKLAANGTNLVLVARSGSKLAKLRQKIQEKYNVKTEIIVQDLTEPDACNNVFNITQGKNLTIDLLVNNAGFGDYGEFAQRDGEQQIKMLQLNVLALVDLTHKYLPLMQMRNKGSIINISSISGFQPIPYFSVYAASKAFVLHFSEALWAENKHYGVRVLAVCPGPTDTNFFTAADLPMDVVRKANSISTPEEVVNNALNSLEKGKSIAVTGGFINQAIVNISRFLPREMTVKILSKLFSSL
ncbi:Short-chain dehydrogenase/reductase SDR [Richelia intracellularis HH01]|uniref:Short-chain dehydrogenase/reductase SDR n=1 Tax=Richelia intracellularis HH01 TaxID=1165094 RepID=M1WZ46_9NOST|nr:SDR family oxidoreductase [Richelia intracellularis]CCH66498.1 Short-chain dehydrogenase/reductase SDR [Richelia intracellularis HH01]